MEDKITLDMKTFRALAAGTRISILKELAKRRKTQSELAKTLGMSVSTIKEHIDNLESAGLVAQVEEGRKWKYYELTKKGSNIISPGNTRIWISLGLTTLALAAALTNLVNKLAPVHKDIMIDEAAPAAGSELLAKSAAEQGPAEIANTIPYSDLVLVLALAILAGILIGSLLKSRK